MKKYKKNFYVIEALFNEHGHFIYDIVEFRRCTVGELYYFVPTESLSLNVETQLISEGITPISFPAETFLFSVFEYIKVHNERFATVIFSCRYSHLIWASAKSRYWRYHLLVHFFPSQRRILQWFSLYVISALCEGLLTYDKNVSRQLNRMLIQTKGELVSRVIEKKSIWVKKNVVGVVGGGAENTQSLSPLLSCLRQNRFENIEFHFFFKGAGSIKWEGQNYVVIKDSYLSSSEYEEAFRGCKYVFLNYPAAYGIRCSGQVLDCAKNMVHPIFSDIATFQNYHSQFNIGVIFSDEAELLDILTKINAGNLEVPSISKKFYDWYSMQNKIDKLAEIFK